MHDVERSKIVLFVLNRDVSDSVELAIDLRAFPEITACQAIELSGYDILTRNSAEKPDAVQPSEHQELLIHADSLTARLRPLSWNLLSLSIS